MNLSPYVAERLRARRCLRYVILCGPQLLCDYAVTGRLQISPPFSSYRSSALWVSDVGGVVV